MSVRPPTRILVAEDDPDIGNLLDHYLKKAGFLPTVVLSGRDVMPQIKRDAPDLVVLDLMLPGLDGLEVCRAIRSDPNSAAIPIIMLTAKAEESDRIVGLELGADDYITKPFSHLELLARVRAVLRRYQNQLPALGEVFESGDLRIDYASRQVTVKARPVRLTPTEYSLLFHLTRNAGRVLPHQTLLAKVWGREYTEEIDYLKVYIRRLRQKLESDTSAIGSIVSERGVGYKFVQA